MKNFNIVIEFDDGTEVVKLVEALSLKDAMDLVGIWARSVSNTGKSWTLIYLRGGAK